MKEKKKEQMCKWMFYRIHLKKECQDKKEKYE